MTTSEPDELPRYHGVSADGVPFAFELTRGSQTFDPDDDNIDARLFVRGRTYFPSVFTPASLTTLMERHERSGELCGGSYFMASDMVIVRRLSIDGLRAAFACLIGEGDLRRIQSEPSEPSPTLSLDELRRALDVVARALEERGAVELELEHDYYWAIPPDERYDPMSDPTELTLGQLHDDAREVRRLLAGDAEPIGYHLV